MIIALSVVIVSLVTAAVLLVIRELHLHAMNVRVSRAVTGVSGETAPFHDLIGSLSSLGMRYRRFYSQDNLDQLRAIVQSSGFNPHKAMPILIGGKTVCMFVFPILGFFLGEFLSGALSDVAILTTIGIVIGVMGPRLILTFVRRRFNTDVQRATPDALDLLTVCTEAGMGLESALQRVVEEMQRSNAAMAWVLQGLLDDLRLLSRKDAFENLARRSTSDGLRRFSVVINQSLQYGTPLSSALRAIAAELRRDRLIKLEDKAHKLGAKLIIPMVIFMLPAMFVILGGSSFLHLVRAFSHH